MNEKDRGPWMHTSLGGKFYPCDPKPEEIFISDIANGLAMDCRYAGQGDVWRYYSVAEHSVHMARYARRLVGMPPAGALIMLLHDGAEAYLNDLAQPVKYAVGFGYLCVERKVQDAIWAKYDLTWRVPYHKRLIKQLDQRIVVNERAAIVRHPQTWPSDIFKPLDGVEIRCWSPHEAKIHFLDEYASICKEMGREIEESEI